ncbi:MAG: hypothetical protein IJ784_13200 [Ruminiclostridium sp.]|nr:hypothetical protein [Ruminiclostridium sp.]
MDYRDFFDKAVSEAFDKYTFSDTEQTMKRIRERTKSMKKKDDKLRQIKFTEVSADYTEPKKSAKVLHAVAGVAGAAAVLTGAVFGLKFLNDHGGLKEGGSDELRAGYHEDISEPAQSEAVVTENAIIASEDVRDKIEIDAAGKAVNGIVPMDHTVELGGHSIHFTGYEFDSVSVKLYYSIIFGEDTVVEPGMQPPISPVDSEWTSMYGADETRKNVMNVTSEFLLYEPVDPARISFTEPESGETLEVTLYCDRDSLIEVHERAVHHIKFTDGRHDRTIFEDMYITPTHALAVFDNGYELPLDTFNEIDLEAGTYDGEVTPKEGRSMCEERGKVYVKWEFEEPTDLARIKNVTLFSSAMTELGIGYSQTFVYGEDYERSKKEKAEANEIRSIEHSPLFTPADEWFDYEHCRAHVTGYIFDGLNGRIRYEVYHDYPVDLFADNSASICNPNTFTEGDVLCSGGEADYDRELEGIAVFCYALHVTEPVDEITIPFCSKWGSAEEQEMTKDYSFTLRYNSDVQRITNDIDKELTFEWGDTVHLDSFVLTPDNLGFRFSGVRYTQTAVTSDPEKIENDPAYMYNRKLCELETVITFKNGGTAVINNKTAVQPSGMPTPNGNAWMFWQFRDSIDISEVASIAVDGLEIYSAENAE